MWTKHLKDQDSRNNFESLLRNNVTLFTRLRAILDDLNEEILRQETYTADFEDPNWSHKQAFRNGQKSILRKMTDLTNFIEGQR